MKGTMRKEVAVFIGVILNVLGRFLSYSLNLPIWFDSIGTCTAAYYTGIWGGLTAGLLGNLLSGVFDVTALVHSLTSVVVALAVHVFIQRGYMNQALKAVIASFWLGNICVICSTPINIIFYDGYSGNLWGDTLVDMLRWYDVSDTISALAGEAIVQIVDKQVCVMAAYIIFYVCARYRGKKGSTIKGTALLLAVGITASLAVPPLNVWAEETQLFGENFVEKIYDNTNGMVSSDANIISETDDGYIWIGSYAGLTKYDGNEFEFIREGGLVNVVGMMTDSRGRLWIGTNDAGIARYEDGKYTYFTEQDGLPSNSIRCFAEDEEGNVYVGTSDKICRFGTDDVIMVIEQDITFAKAMVIYENMLVVMDNNGGIYALDEDKVFTIKEPAAKDFFYYCLAVTSRGLMAGTETGELLRLEVSGNEVLVKKETDIFAEDISAIFEDSQNRIWIATDSGFGYLDTDNHYHRMNYEGFDSAIVCFHEDYQGNIWIASNRYGVMKLSESRFVNILEKSDIENRAINAVVAYNGDYYFGADDGLLIVDSSDWKSKVNELTEMTEGDRVRALFTDSENRLWICTYGGLICYKPGNEVRCYTVENDNTTSDRFRCITELKDGTLVAGTADGINFIQNNEVTNTLTAEDGMANTQILSIVEGSNGEVLAGSDGSGIYVIKEGQLVENYTVEDGLSSNIILRIISHADGYLVVTSNALCHIDLDGTIRKLVNFPYFNNYDVIISGETAYITCSAGMYQIKLAELCADDMEQVKFYGASEGLLSGLTANSWNYLAEDGNLYLCSNNGVTVFDGGYIKEETDLKYSIVSVEYGDTKLEVGEDKNILISSEARDISIYASVRNYAFADVKVQFYAEELDAHPKLYDWNEIEPIQILKPEISEYHIHFRILDNTGTKVLQEETYTIGRERQLWEQPWYVGYLVIVCIEVFLCALISVVSMILFTIRKNELERQQIELEKKVNEQTEELRLQQQKTKKFFLQTVTALSEAVDAKDRYTSGHSKRVAEYAQMIAARMGKNKEEQEEIYRAGLLHDVGKIRVPVEIINKTGKLTDEEYNIIKIHPVTGYHILRGISGSNFIAVAAKYHHERYDGKGYPNGLAGETIPEVARILGVADSYDAMTSNRSYRKALDQAVVRSEIEKGRGTQFDPAIADIMLQLMDEDTEYTMKQADSMQRRILVVDDEAISIKLLEGILRDEPMYQIVSAEGGETALEILKTQSFDLILLDVNMPGMSGLETLKKIRETYQTPVALMTGDRDMETFSQFIELGCDDYITKPFMPLLLKESLHNMLERTII